MNSVSFRLAPPRASALIEALRGLGYTTSTALADLVDNSITAQATHVDIRFYWGQANSRISIIDNGRGMSAAELDKAMRLGAHNPLKDRALNDLGRFGLGLKTASFSQCRSLTAATLDGDSLQCLRWDLDMIANSKDDDWYLLEGPDPRSEALIADFTSNEHGTMVLWEKLDRVVTEGFTEQNFLDLMDRVESHLAMIFHRYLEGPNARLTLSINNKPIKPWDPFLSGHPAKAWHSPSASPSRNSGVQIECHVLPHKDRLSTRDYESAQGPDGWTAQQGFYVYRNERLLIGGSWLALGRGRSWTKDEAHKLARIRLDINNRDDHAWKIDIRKSTARPPVVLREWLVRLAEETRSRARRAFAHRGRVNRIDDNYDVTQAWVTERLSQGIRYRINTEHPCVKALLENSDIAQNQVNTLLRVLEETVPVQRIWLDTEENRETPRTTFDGTPPEEVLRFIKVIFKQMTRTNGMSAQLARERLLQTEPFQHYPDLVNSLSADT